MTWHLSLPALLAQHSVPVQFPWRSSANAWQVLVCEVLLVRTSARTVANVAPRLLRRYPDPISLAAADTAEVAALIEPLGLQHKRATNLIAVAECLVVRHSGSVPEDHEALVSLPGVGRYVASAVRCFGFGLPVAVVDSNVARVYGRFFALPRPRRIDSAAWLWDFATDQLRAGEARVSQWVLLDFGRDTCRPGRPMCQLCPVMDLCQAHANTSCSCQGLRTVPDTRKRRSRVGSRDSRSPAEVSRVTQIVGGGGASQFEIPGAEGGG